jgi:hypothetical protein
MPSTNHGSLRPLRRVPGFVVSSRAASGRRLLRGASS